MLTMRCYLLLGMGFAFSAAAQVTDLDEIRFSGNIHHALPGQSGQLISSDEQVAVFSLTNGTATNISLVDNLDAADLDAYQQGDDCGPELFSVDVLAAINGQAVRPADIFAADGSLVFDADSLGLPANSNIDAVTRDPINCDLIISFDDFIELNSSVLTGGDLIRWNTTGGFSQFSAALSGLPVNALYLLDNGNLLVSFAEEVTIQGTNAQQSDVVEFTNAQNGLLAFSPISIDSSWQGVNLNALSASRAPIPGQLIWSVNTVEAFENNGSVTLTINRINGTEAPITVNYATIAASAQPGDDFVGINATVNFADGQTSSIVTINLLDDPDIEGNETFFVDLVAVTAGDATIGNPRRIQVLLRDDEDFIFADSFED